MAIDISSTTRRIVYTGSAGVGPYAFNFEVLAQTDIAVYFNDTELTLTTDYTVSIDADGTGSVTIVVGTNVPTTPDADDRITIVGDRTIQRTTDFTTGGPLFATSLNDEFDSLTIFTQQNKEEVDRAIKAPVTDPSSIDMTLPKDDDRKGKYLSFNASTGNPEVVNTVTDVTTIAGIASDVTTVSGIAANVTTVAGVSANVTTVAGSISNVNTVSSNIADVNTTATNIADITTVADDLNEAVSEIETVAASIANVNTVGTNIANVNTVAGISANVTTVAGISSNVTTVAGVSADVTTVAGINADVTTVAADGTDIGTVATDIANVNTTATNIANVNTVAGISANVTTVAGISSDVTTVATNVTDITNFSDVYLGPKASDPTLRNDGSALQAGDLYFNTSGNVVKAYTGSAWEVAFSGGSGYLQTSNNLSDLGDAPTALSNLGVSSTAAELNVLDGITASTAELNYVNGVTSNVQTQLDAKATQNSLGVRNLIINGDMRIAQRGTSTSGYIYSGYTTVDRFQFNASSIGAYTISQDTDVPTGQGFSNSSKILCTTADASPASSDFLTIVQKIEAQNLQHLKFGTANAESLTLSFWVKSNKTGTYVLMMYRPDSGRLLSKTYTIDSANTWEKKTITVAGDTTGSINNDNGDGLNLYWHLADGSDRTSGTPNTDWGAYSTPNEAAGQTVNLADSTSNYINITGVQLEVGTEATPFEHRPYDMELQRCQRYYYTGGSGSNKHGGLYAGSLYIGQVYFPTTMRASPTVTVVGGTGAAGTASISDFSFTKTGDGNYITNWKVDAEL